MDMGMAKAKENQAVNATNDLSMGLGILVPLAVAGLAGAFWSWPAFVFLTFALLPSIVAAAVDRSTMRCAMLCVTSFNISGLAPFAIRFWSAPDTYAVAVALMTDVYSWLIIYSAAGVGWILYSWFGFISFQLHRVWRDRRVAKLNVRRAKMIEAMNLKLSKSLIPSGAGITAIQWKHDRIEEELAQIKSSIMELEEQARWTGQWIAALFSVVGACGWILMYALRLA
jgi:hypothetical protein